MSQSEFEKAMAALRRRQELLRMAQAGHADVRMVAVKGCQVPTFWRSAHRRRLITLRKEPKAALAGGRRRAA